ncbi:MAG: hypothetical protein KG028_00085 [Actinobacteria bacterium]|jgi:hypothetical protein|nr:hypothetical protein [Actinomycetota bacterium]
MATSNGPAGSSPGREPHSGIVPDAHVFRGRVVLAVAGSGGRGRVTVIDRHGRRLSAPASEVAPYAGPSPVLAALQVEAHRAATRDDLAAAAVLSGRCSDG